MSGKARALVVDDEANIRDVIRFALSAEGIEVVEAASAERARSANPSSFDVVVLDVMLPGQDGLTFCRDVRKDSAVPILFLSARSDEFDRVFGLEIGADDYLTKPFSTRELVARVKALLRRGGQAREPAKSIARGELLIELEQHRVTMAGTEMLLTPTEFGLLVSLYERPGFVLSRSQLMEKAYAYDNLVTERTIDTHVKRIRSKFREVCELDPIATVHGVGYKAGF